MCCWIPGSTFASPIEDGVIVKNELPDDGVPPLPRTRRSVVAGWPTRHHQSPCRFDTTTPGNGTSSARSRSRGYSSEQLMLDRQFWLSQDDDSEAQVGDLSEFEGGEIRALRFGLVGTLNFKRPWVYTDVSPTTHTRSTRDSTVDTDRRIEVARLPARHTSACRSDPECRQAEGAHLTGAADAVWRSCPGRSAALPRTPCCRPATTASSSAGPRPGNGSPGQSEPSTTGSTRTSRSVTTRTSSLGRVTWVPARLPGREQPAAPGIRTTALGRKADLFAHEPSRPSSTTRRCSSIRDRFAGGQC